MITRRMALGASMGAAAAALAPGDAFARVAASSVLTDAMAGTQTPGMAALVIRNWRAEREMVAGVRKLGDPTPVARGDRWHLGSDGKAMTATLVAHAVEQGALSWTSRLDQLLPDLAAVMHPSYRDVTLPDLLSHRSGLPENIVDIEKFFAFYGDPAPPREQRSRYLAEALTDPPVVEKRTTQSYSNTGLLAAGAAVERAMGDAFEALIGRHVFTPLRMRSVSLDPYGGSREPRGHVDGRIADQERDANPRFFAPAGNFRMTLNDWSRFCIDHLNGERGRGRLLRQESYRFLHTPQGETTAALGWGRQERAAGRQGPVLVHAGSDGNWFALVMLFPATGEGVLVAANAGESMGGDAAGLGTLRALAATVSRPAETPAQ
ncbi:serine hydrolase domain-containing protein [Terricaulis sp.]|uniref:serine hydrolase domain-containing protein n=1 Tax=Terricaulis sp. TaxID=2768686 RepID=UPI003782E491